MAELTWVEGSANVSNIVKSLATALTGGEHAWLLEYPIGINDITTTAIISTTTTFAKKFYVKFERPIGSLTYMNVTIGTELTGDKSDFADGKHDIPSRWAWYRQNPDSYLGDWLPVKYWISFNKDYANIVIQGDAGMDTYPYNNYLISPCFLGACKSYTGAIADTDYNFFKTVGSDVQPTQDTTYGLRTATGVMDFSFVATLGNGPYQAYTFKCFADNPNRDKHIMGPSVATKKHHSSEISLVHATEGERGTVQNALILDMAAIIHTSELILDKGTPTEKTYLFFAINAPYSFVGGGANPTYGIALRKA